MKLKFNFKTVAEKAYAERGSLLPTPSYAEFFKRYLLPLKNRKTIYEGLQNLRTNLSQAATKALVTEKHYALRKVNVFEKTVIDKNFHQDIVKLYYSVPPIKHSLPDYPKNILGAALVAIGDAVVTMEMQVMAEVTHKRNVIDYILKNGQDYGIHPGGWFRDASHKRYNILIEHGTKKDKQSVCKVLLSLDKIESHYLHPWEKKKPILFSGAIIPFKTIQSIRVTSTLLTDTEIELFRHSHGIEPTEDVKFFKLCNDETELLVKNPYLEDKQQSKDNFYIDTELIKELKKIKNKDFDTKTLVQLCDAMNVSYRENNYHALLATGRNIMHHVPPIFQCPNFESIVNNYKDKNKARSFKNAMKRLHGSFKDLADHHGHLQVGKTELLPTHEQIDFKPEFAFLIQEIIRILK